VPPSDPPFSVWTLPLVALDAAPESPAVMPTAIRASPEAPIASAAKVAISATSVEKNFFISLLLFFVVDC
jgi:hypothetical protein